jgi:hypothetical protein
LGIYEIVDVDPSAHPCSLLAGCDIRREQVLTPVNSHWYTGVNRLSGPGGCANTPGTVTGTCKEVPMKSKVLRDLPPEHRGSVKRLREEILDKADLVYGLAGLRDHGLVAESAVTQALDLREVEMLRLSWQLIEALIEGDGGTPEVIFDAVFGVDGWRRARYALFGEAFGA